MDGQFAYEFLWFGATDAHDPFEFIGFWDMDGNLASMSSYGLGPWMTIVLMNS